MLKRKPEEDLLAYCADNEIGVVAYSPLRSGILTDQFGRRRLGTMAENDWRRGDSDFQEPRVTINIEFTEKLRDIAANIDQPLSNLAVAWVLARPEVTSAIVGARRRDQIENTAPGGDLQLSPQILTQIEALLAEREKELAEAETLAA